MVLISRGLSGFYICRAIQFSKASRGCAGRGLEHNRIYLSLGDDSDEGTPLPIPNRVVKLVSADGTAAETPWESRSSPIFYILIGAALLVRPFLRVVIEFARRMVSSVLAPLS